MKSTDYDIWKESCWDNEDAIDNNEGCYAIWVGAYYSAYNANVYALDWPQCYTEESWTLSYRQSSHLHKTADKHLEKLMKLDEKKLRELGLKMPKKHLKQMHANIKNGNLKPLVMDDVDISKDQEGTWTTSDSSYVACSEYNAIEWLRAEEVQTALNVKTLEWGVCSDEVYDAWPEIEWYYPMEEYYADIISNYAEEQQLKLMIYSGDDDSVCATSGTQFWLSRWDGYIANDIVDWQPWRDEALQLGGYYTIYHSEDNTDFNALHLMTIRTAGHMVPTTQPKRSLTVLKKYLYEIEDYQTAEGDDGV